MVRTNEEAETKEETKNRIEIYWMTDEIDYADCGPHYADGAIVKLNGEPFLNLTPLASCFGGDDYPEGEVYLRILSKLGYEVDFEFDYDSPDYEDDSFDT